MKPRVPGEAFLEHAVASMSRLPFPSPSRLRVQRHSLAHIFGCCFSDVTGRVSALNTQGPCPSTTVSAPLSWSSAFRESEAAPSTPPPDVQGCTCCRGQSRTGGLSMAGGPLATSPEGLTCWPRPQTELQSCGRTRSVRRTPSPVVCSVPASSCGWKRSLVRVWRLAWQRLPVPVTVVSRPPPVWSLRLAAVTDFHLQNPAPGLDSQIVAVRIRQ